MLPFVTRRRYLRLLNQYNNLCTALDNFCTALEKSRERHEADRRARHAAERNLETLQREFAEQNEAFARALQASNPDQLPLPVVRELSFHDVQRSPDTPCVACGHPLGTEWHENESGLHKECRDE